jgi:hypothetical protein
MLLQRISKPLVKRGLLRLEVSRGLLLLLRVSKRLARRALLLLLHRVKPLLQPGRKAPILLQVLCKGLLPQLARRISLA